MGNSAFAWIRNRRITLAVVGVMTIAYWQSLPGELFRDPYCTVLESSNGTLLSAAIARDGQWRFPEGDTVPAKFVEALITFEDKRFRYHPGVDVLSMARAMRQNMGADRIVSGGSTLSMQVIRLSRKGKPRSWFEKAIEIVLATRLELRYSKDEILSMYASHAPFGGNVVGLEAACWRYFGIDAKDLSWAEAALLAVLPNAPSMIHPGKNRKLLKAKRDKLLDKLQAAQKIDAFTCSLAKEEPVPLQPHALPRMARHLLLRMSKEGFAEKKVASTINEHLQRRVEQIVEDHHYRLKANQVWNAAVVVLSVNSGHAMAYAGNVATGGENGTDVDIITSPRSTGSILKPFLYAAMQHEGKMLPRTMLPDVPLIINGFAPRNFSKEYDGAVNADHALIRSLNVPAVYMLKDYRYEKFHSLLKDMGITTLSKPADHYGLSLILGGAEATLWDLAGAYASMARTLNRYFDRAGKNRYDKNDFHPATYTVTTSDTTETGPSDHSWLSASSIFLTFGVLKEVYRPGEETGWRYFNSAKQIAWKTGTSFGFRDGWAIGVTSAYVVGVWVGNADGEGRPGLTGTEAAAPLMFDVFAQLPASAWFKQPHMEMQRILTCKKSGYRRSAYCDETDTVWVTKESLGTPACPYHTIVHLTADMKYRLHSECARIDKMKHLQWFVLPPVQEYYFRSKNLSYKSLPPYRNDCQLSTALAGMDMIYPKPYASIFIPRDIDGKPGSSVFEAANRNPDTAIFWHLDGEYIGTTKKVHRLAINPKEGAHILTLIDEHGEALERHFEVISRI